MKKQDLIKHLSEKFGLTHKVVNDVLTETFDLIDETVKNGDVVCFNGRRFKPMTRKARSCRNPRTQAVVQVPEKKFIVYRKRIG